MYTIRRGLAHYCFFGGGSSYSRIFSLIWRRHHDRWRAANFGLCPALVAIEQWGFFSVPHLLWHWISVYNSHLQETVTLTPIAERLTVELSLPVITTYTQPTAYGANALTHCATATAHYCGQWSDKFWKLIGRWSIDGACDVWRW